MTMLLLLAVITTGKETFFRDHDVFAIIETVHPFL